METPNLYQEYYVKKQDERTGLFSLITETFKFNAALYPGCFTHITPAFFIPLVCFVDTDRRAEKFFRDPGILTYINSRKVYSLPAKIHFHHFDYQEGFPEQPSSFDLLISQYAGFISQACKKYLKVGGYLMVNNSHGDAGMANLDDDFKLVGAIDRRGAKFSLTTRDLDQYFVTKKPTPITQEYLQNLGRGIGYKKVAFSYLFIRTA